MDFDEIAADKAQRRRALAEALTRSPAETGTAREQLQALLPADIVDEVDRRVLALVLDDELEPELDPISASLAAKNERKRALADVVRGRRTTEQPPVGSGSLDGGARRTPPAKPKTHEQTLTEILRSGEANVGSNL